MEDITKYDGAVFYVDILGMSALTNNTIPLVDEDFRPWLNQYDFDFNNHFLAASILVEFRKILTDMSHQFNNVTIAQLSDSAFVWSRDIVEITIFASKFMTLALESGILCRGGLSYGEILETNQNHILGRFIVGKAVTEAVKLEGIAKGARVLINEDFPGSLSSINESFAMKTIPLFKPFVNPLDYRTYDEFKWYLCPNLSIQIEDLNNLRYKERVELTKQRLKIANKVRCSPKMNWNSRTENGQIQLIATINFIAEDGHLGVFHSLAWQSLVGKRSEDTVSRMEKVIENDENYSYEITGID